MRSLRPLAVAGLTALVATALLVLSVAGAWLGPDVDRGANFCEAGGGWVPQPANTLSNLGFVLAGLLIAWHAGRADRLGETLPRLPGLATGYACVVVLLGPASAAMHATESILGGDLDLLSMHLVSSFAAAYALIRCLGLGRHAFGGLFLLFVAGCQLIGLYDGRVPVVDYAANVAFAALLLTAIALEVLLWRRTNGDPTRPRTDLAWGGAALGCLLAAFAIWNATKSRWCDPGSWLQGHAAWHLLCATAAYLLFRLWASERRDASEGTSHRSDVVET